MCRSGWGGRYAPGVQSSAPLPFPFHDREAGSWAPGNQSAAVDHRLGVKAAAATWAYRRQARRLRHLFRGNPAGLHASLMSLAREADAAAPPRHVRHSVINTRQVRARVVAAAAAEPARPSPGNSPVNNSPIGNSPTGNSPTGNAPVGDGVRGVLNAPPDVVDRFAVLVRAMLDEGMIRYSRRQALLRRADRLGIGRFEAALVIAAVEHRHRTYAAPGEVPPSVRRRSVGLAVCAVLLAEAAGAAVVWSLLA